MLPDGPPEESPFFASPHQADWPQCGFILAGADEKAVRLFDSGMALWLCGWHGEAWKAFHQAGLAAPLHGAPQWAAALCHLPGDAPRALWQVGLGIRKGATLSPLERSLATALRELLEPGDTAAPERFRRYLAGLDALRKADPDNFILTAIWASAAADYQAATAESAAPVPETLAALAALGATPAQHPVQVLRLRLAVLAGDVPLATSLARECLGAFPGIPAVHRAAAAAAQLAGDAAGAGNHLFAALECEARHAATAHKAWGRTPGLYQKLAFSLPAFLAAGQWERSALLATMAIRAPRHPWHSVLDEPEPAPNALAFSLPRLGRAALCDSLIAAGQWEALAAAARTDLLPATRLPHEAARHHLALGWVAFARQDAAGLAAALTAAEQSLQATRAARATALAQADDIHRSVGTSASQLRTSQERILTDFAIPMTLAQDCVDELRLASTVAAGGSPDTTGLLRRLTRLPPLRRAWWQHRLDPAAPSPPAMPPSLGNLQAFPAWEAPPWALPDGTGRTWHQTDFHGQALVLSFFQGHTCDRCLYQLGGLAARRPAFTAAGMALAAIADDRAEFMPGIRSPQNGQPLPFCVAADETRQAFRDWRVVSGPPDAPETLHALLLVAPSGQVLWQDVDYVPFTDLDFLLPEFQRLLALAPVTTQPPVKAHHDGLPSPMPLPAQSSPP
jgi:peroxiredoxin